MRSTNIVLAIRGATGWIKVGLLALMLAIVALLSYWFALLSPDEQQFNTWWPAAGAVVVVAFSVHKKHRLLVLAPVAVITVIVLTVAGRSFGGALIAGITVAIEAWIITRFVSDRDGQVRLTTLPDVSRFFIGVLLGSLFVGIVTALAFGFLVGGEWLVPALTRAASHASAIVLIVPIFLVTQVVVPKGEPIGRIVHSVLLVASVVISFAPGQFSSLAFLPLPFLVWSAFTFTMAFTLLEIAGTSLIALILTMIGGGPFNEAQGAELSPALLLQLWVITLSVSAMLVAANRNERQQVDQQMEATARLLYEGFEISKNGFAIVQADQGNYTLLEANHAASILLPTSLVTMADGHVEVVPGSGLHSLLGTMVLDKTGEVTVTGDDELPVTVTVTNVDHSTFGQILLVSIIDLRPLREAEAVARRQLDGEHAVVAELRALNQQKDDFVSSVTHELRTPITTIMGFAEELDSTQLDEEQADYVAIIQRNAERLLSVVEDVLTFSRRGPDTVGVVTVGEVDVTTVITSVLDDLRHSIRDKRIDVITDLPDEPLLVVAQQDYVARVMINIITNSVKFTPLDGRLVIVASLHDAVAEITITDNGPGVALQDIDKVFDKFYRSSRAAHDGVPGTGLGLSIVRELVTAMEGTVALESDGSSGTTARLVLPAANTERTVDATSRSELDDTRIDVLD